MKAYGLKDVMRNPKLKCNTAGHHDGCLCKLRRVRKGGHRRIVKMKLAKEWAK